MGPFQESPLSGGFLKRQLRVGKSWRVVGALRGKNLPDRSDGFDESPMKQAPLRSRLGGSDHILEKPLSIIFFATWRLDGALMEETVPLPRSL